MSDMEDNINFGDDVDMVEVENDEFEDQFNDEDSDDEEFDNYETFNKNSM